MVAWDEYLHDIKKTRESAAWDLHFARMHVGKPNISRQVHEENRLAVPRGDRAAATKPLDLVLGDLANPMQIVSQGGSRYFPTILDNASRLSLLRFIEILYN